MSVKAVLDVCVLISASIHHNARELNVLIKHDHYDRSKSLINYLDKHREKEIGLYTESIKQSAVNCIKDAVSKTIEQIKSKEKTLDEKKLLEIFEIIATSCIIRLDNNFKVLKLERKFKKMEIGELRGQVLGFYYILKSKIEKMDPEIRIKNFLRSKQGKRIRGLRRYIKIQNIRNETPHNYYILKNKFSGNEFKKMLGDVDVLAETIYLHKKYKKKDIKVMLISNDYHFVAIGKKNINKFVPDEIKKRFNIYCLNPEEGLQIIKEENQEVKK